MAIPKFGYFKIEALACLLMLLAGVAGLFVAVTGWSDWIHWFSWSPQVFPHVSRFWLVLQSLAVIAGARGAWQSTSFVLAAVGIGSALIVQTAVGCVCLLPGILMLLLTLRRLGAYDLFHPRWKGPGPPPPGAWRS